jgi:hypothetical protein
MLLFFLKVTPEGLILFNTTARAYFFFFPFFFLLFAILLKPR